MEIEALAKNLYEDLGESACIALISQLQEVIKANK
jgi:hypothetical protein